MITEVLVLMNETEYPIKLLMHIVLCCLTIMFWTWQFLTILAVNDAGIDGNTLQGPVEEVAKMEAQEAENLLQHLGIPVL